MSRPRSQLHPAVCILLDSSRFLESSQRYLVLARRQRVGLITWDVRICVCLIGDKPKKEFRVERRRVWRIPRQIDSGSSNLHKEHTASLWPARARSITATRRPVSFHGRTPPQRESGFYHIITVQISRRASMKNDRIYPICRQGQHPHEAGSHRQLRAVLANCAVRFRSRMCPHCNNDGNVCTSLTCYEPVR